METINKNGQVICVIDKNEKITSVQDALDMMSSAYYNHDCAALIVYKESLDEAFFDLKTGIAGEILQKFSNYRLKLAIVGDFSVYGSKSLRDFIYECNKGNSVYFVSSVDEARDRLL